MPMHPSYDPSLVILSLIVAILASYTALDLSGRVYANVGRVRLLWIVGGAFAMGAGIWTMHFVGMLAFRLARARVIRRAAGRALDRRRDERLRARALGGEPSAGAPSPRTPPPRWRWGSPSRGCTTSAWRRCAWPRTCTTIPLRWWLSIAIAIGASFVALDLARRFSGSETRRARADARRGRRS